MNSPFTEPVPASRILLRARPPKPRWGAAVLGALLALMAAEVALRPFAGQLNRAEARPLLADSLDAPVRTVRYFDEGIAVSHFTASRRRLTGHPHNDSSPNVVLLGKSFVEALQLPDQQTMGAQLEDLSRSSGTPVNAIQYGFEGASPPKYALEKDGVFELWRPAMVVVLVDAQDFIPAALENSWTRAELRGGQVYAERVPDPSRTSFQGRWLRLRKFSALLETMVRRRTDVFPFLRPVSDELTQPDRRIASAFIAMLKESYGERLFVLYVANPGLNDGSEQEPAEKVFFAACSSINVRGTSIGPGAREALRRRQFLVSGFTNSAPGWGHLNRAGHLLAAQAIWREIGNRHLRTKP
jgi:hypothetical protein